MVKAWMLGNFSVDQRAENHQNPPVFVDVASLKKVGVLYFQLNPLDYEAPLHKIRTDRNYNYADNLTINKDSLPNYDELVKTWFCEHVHADEEIRFVLDGNGYMDVRDLQDRWIRILIEAGDLLVLPAGMYHRFSPTKQDYMKVIRLFSGDPVWTAYFRPSADQHPARRAYLNSIKRGAFQAKSASFFRSVRSLFTGQLCM